MATVCRHHESLTAIHSGNRGAPDFLSELPSLNLNLMCGAAMGKKNTNPPPKTYFGSSWQAIGGRILWSTSLYFYYLQKKKGTLKGEKRGHARWEILNLAGKANRGNKFSSKELSSAFGGHAA